MSTRGRLLPPLLISAALGLLSTHSVATEQRPGTGQAPRTGKVSSPISVGRNVHVSVARGRYAHYELLAGAHGSDARKLMACSMVTVPETGSTHSIVYTSTDGGLTWTETLDAGVGDLTGDPVCEYGVEDKAYFVALTLKAGEEPRMLVYRSADGGVTWSEPTGLPFIDREWLIVDRTSGKYHGRIYINGTGSVRGIDDSRKSAVTLFRSEDGVTFLGPIYRSAVGPQHVYGMGNSAVLSDGTLVTLFGLMKDQAASAGRMTGPPSANAWLRVVMSTDGGETYSDGAVVAEWYQQRSVGRALAVDPGSAAFKDRLYAVFADSRSGRAAVLLSHSSDQGKTWSPPVEVADDRTREAPEEGPELLLPSVAVNRDGVVGVVWYDRRDHANNLGWDMRFTASLDGGETFLPSVRVSEIANTFGGKEMWPVRTSVSGGGTPTRRSEPSNARQPLGISMAVNSFFYTAGHTSGFVVGAAGTFHPIWVDNRTGVSQLWTAPVAVQGKAVRHGATDLTSLDDVTPHVTMEVSDTTYDRASNIGSMTARLKNTSEVAVAGPLKARVIALSSGVGVPKLLDASNGKDGVGAVWDFSDAVEGGRLAPGATSGPKSLRFSLSDLRPLRRGSRFNFGLIDLRVRVYGHSEKPKPDPKSASNR